MDWNTEITKASERISSHIQKTPVLSCTGFGLDFPIQLKLEQVQHTGSFKARGAFNTLLSHDVPEAGLVAASGGNHGAAVAYAAHQLGHRARIYVPEMAGPAKISLIRNSGADLQVVPGAYANAMEQAQAYEAETGAMQVHAYDAPATVAGQGTCFAEWQAQGLEADTLMIAVGGGGLVAGALAWFQRAKKIIAVEPETSCALHAALKEGSPVDVEVSGVAANALGAKRIGQICFDHAREQDITSLTVSDAAITSAQAALWRERRLLVEPAGATALAALTSGAYRPAEGERVAVLLCGGNIAPDPLA
ncbi:threonine dehydratase [Roseobacter sp. SK209-2-6]|uniref:threonine/serine dehydratase n=1 Tax=Roseobacter sp. SK209-2-6 TaxID=388739 RepID=UPI0000F3D22B|nr:threonine/serine dehydratase [Roseobacter sp. SK209-2-6]EBA17121.1 threonine dehydratase [Roseobacter sp. SK209-2-6]